ncbi:MAG: bifunctional oligoribonuclease/PAP phosphatase NrnA [Candidatus Berkelbacteria bacterium]|nr:bifunctional oligoribonuclease/PAP phosphatase NrnA [Candidatus Berkelbacteria bacterium]MCR4308068.1 bifunctional oligoribonuclease/PAP phosphatase NrnA [Candidatus Berkelbacteria bacterium]
MSTAKSIAGSLRTAHSIALILHQNPDGDVIGSALALERSLPSKKIRIVCVNPVADVFTEALGPFAVESTLLQSANLFVVLDCPDLKRTGFATHLTKLAKNKKLIVIDHHQKGDLAILANEYHHDLTASSTCEMVASVIDELRLPINSSVATALLLGIHTDTGGFQYPNTTSETLKLAARLVRQGADYQRIRQTLGPQRDLKKMRLWGEVLGSVSINSLGIAVARVSKATLAKTSATESDLAGLAKYLCSIEGTKATLVLVETDAGWRGSLRTQSRTFNVGRLAKLLGGSGGRKVAGFLATEELVSDKIDSV